MAAGPHDARHLRQRRLQADDGRRADAVGGVDAGVSQRQALAVRAEEATRSRRLKNQNLAAAMCTKASYGSTATTLQPNCEASVDAASPLPAPTSSSVVDSSGRTVSAMMATVSAAPGVMYSWRA